MAKQLLGKEVNEALVAALQGRTAALKEKGITRLVAGKSVVEHNQYLKKMGFHTENGTEVKDL